MIGHLNAVTTNELAELINCTDEEEIRALLTSKYNQDDDINSLYLEKTWHGLDFLLNGDSVRSEPLS